MHDDVQVIAHNRPGVHAAGENVSQLQNTSVNPRFSVFKAFVEVFVQAARPRSTHTVVHAMKRSGLGGVDELAARLGHGRSLGARALMKIRLSAVLGRIYLRRGC